MPNQGAGNRGAPMGWARAQVSFGPGARTTWGAEVAPPSVGRSPLAQWWGPRAPRGKRNEAQSHCLQHPRPQPEPGAPTPPAHSVSHSPTPQLRANRAKAIFFFFLQVNEISCLLGKTLTLLVKETQWLAKSTHRSRKRSPTLRHV